MDIFDDFFGTDADNAAFRAAQDAARVAEFAAAFAAGDFQIVDDFSHETMLVTIGDSIYTGYRADHYGVNGFLFSGFPFSTDMVIVTTDAQPAPESHFRGVVVELPADAVPSKTLVAERGEAISRHEAMRREAARDPEGAFGGRGNNLTAGQ